MRVRKTRRGWVVEITNTVHGCLEQGGVCGREELYTRETLAGLGIDYDADPAASVGFNDPGVSYLDYLVHSVRCDRVLRVGHVIE